MCSYWRCSFLDAPRRCFLPGISDPFAFTVLEPAKNSPQLSRVTRFVGGHLLEFHLQLDFAEFFRKPGVLGVVVDVFHFQMQIQFYHRPDARRSFKWTRSRCRIAAKIIDYVR